MTPQELRRLFQGELPGEAAHRDFLPMRGSSKAAIESGLPYKLSAVAVLLFQNDDGQLSTLVTQRQIYDGSHSGQISFPGGKFEDSDAHLVHTAIRETREEIGIDISNAEKLGQLTSVYIPVSQFLVEPHVFFLPEQPRNFYPSEREVKRIHRVELPKLFVPEAVQHLDLTMPNGILLKQVPHFVQNDLRIWGATAVMLNELKFLLKF